MYRKLIWVVRELKFRSLDICCIYENTATVPPVSMCATGWTRCAKGSVLSQVLITYVIRFTWIRSLTRAAIQTHFPSLLCAILSDRRHGPTLWNYCPVQQRGWPGSVVGIATGYGLDGPGIESRWEGARFSAPVQTSPESHPASCTMGTGSFPGIKSGRGVTLTTHPLLVPWSWKSRAIPLIPL